MWSIIRKIIFILLLILVLLIAGIPAALQLQPVKNFLANTVEKQVSASLNAELSIGRLGGNILRTLALTDVVLTQEGDTLAAPRDKNDAHTPGRRSSGGQL